MRNRGKIGGRVTTELNGEKRIILRSKKKKPKPSNHDYNICAEVTKLYLFLEQHYNSGKFERTYPQAAVNIS